MVVWNLDLREHGVHLNRENTASKLLSVSALACESMERHFSFGRGQADGILEDCLERRYQDLSRHDPRRDEESATARSKIRKTTLAASSCTADNSPTAAHKHRSANRSLTSRLSWSTDWRRDAVAYDGRSLHECGAVDPQENSCALLIRRHEVHSLAR